MLSVWTHRFIADKPFFWGDASISSPSLRQEILDQFNREFNTVSLGLSATGAIVGFGLSQVEKNTAYQSMVIEILDFLTRPETEPYTSIALAASHSSLVRNPGWYSV